MSESDVDELVEEIVSNVYQDGVYVVRNGRHRRLTPKQVRERWTQLIQHERDRGSTWLKEGHEERLYAYVRGHQVAFVWMDLDMPPKGHRGDWMPITETSW